MRGEQERTARASSLVHDWCHHIGNQTNRETYPWPSSSCLQKLKNKNPACKIDMDFNKHKKAVLLSSQMPTQNYKNNDIDTYLEPQTRNSLKKIILCTWWKSKLRKTVWIMNEIINSIIDKFVSNKDKKKKKLKLVPYFQLC